jgi:hypothetical protein
LIIARTVVAGQADVALVDELALLTLHGICT